MILAYAQLKRIPEEQWPELLCGIETIARELKDVLDDERRVAESQKGED